MDLIDRLIHIAITLADPKDTVDDISIRVLKASYFLIGRPPDEKERDFIKNKVKNFLLMR